MTPIGPRPRSIFGGRRFVSRIAVAVGCLLPFLGMSTPAFAASAQDLTVAKTHSGDFAQGQTGASYTITVTNIGGTATSGTVTVTDTLPTGMTATAMAGTGWSCSVPSLSCTRSDALAGGASYPPITLTVNVAGNAPSGTNVVTVSGGGETNTVNDTAADPTTVTPPPDMTIAKSHSGNFTEGQTGATYTITATNSGVGVTSGTVTVTDTLPTGLTATAISGTGWSCTLATLTCTRSDSLAALASYPAITLTVNVAGNAPASVTNTATVSGGGETNTSNDTASDPTTVNAVPDLTIAKTHTGNFTQGQTGATYTITVSNAGGAPTSGTVTVTDTLPTELTATAISGTGWSCTLNTPPLTCTRSDALAAATPYPAITLTVNVASNAPASVTNTATVSGGGETNTSNDTASDPTTISGVPDLTIAKTHTGNFTQGQTGATYTITVSNAGRAPTSGTVTVTDTLPAGMTATAMAGTGWVCTVVSGLTCNRVDPLAGGASYPPITLTVTVAGNATSGTNTATVSGGGETNTTNDSASDLTTVTPPPDLTIAKTHTGNFTQGQTGATYTITVSNAGGAPTSGTVNVTDTLPAGMTATAIAGTGWTCSVPSLSCTRSDALAAATPYPAITLTVNVASNAPASVTNTATVSGGGETNTSNDTASDPTTISGVPDLTIAKTHTGNFTQGQTGTYTITVSNAGGAPTSGTVTVTDTLPPGLTATAISGTGWSCTLNTPPLTCTRGDTLLAAASYPAITLTVDVASNAPASVTNTATVSGGGETNTSNDTASDPTTITGVPDLTIAKTHTGNFTQGQTGATYTITVSNGGRAPTSGTVTVTDTLPAGMTATAMAGSGWTCTLAPLTCTRSDALAGGASYPAITLTVNVAGTATSGTNTATVSGGGETNTANDTASDPTTVAPAPDLTVAKTHTGNFAQGQTGATYTITVTNGGPGATFGTVTVTDTLPAGFTATAISGTGWTCTLATRTCTRSDALAPGTSYPVITLTVNVASNAASGTNTVTVSGGGENNTANDSASDPTTVATASDLTIAKTHVGNFAQGQTGATYSIVVSNRGGGVSSGTVTVTDTLPAGLTATAIAGTGWTCTLATLTCTRSDALAASASYPTITLTVNVAANASASVTNTASVSGGGEANTTNNSSSDPTTIAPGADLTIAKTHVGNFAQGQTGATYTITATNAGTGVTSGTVTVTDTLPAGLTATAIAGTGWTCTLATLTCTRSDTLAAAASYPAITLTVNVASNAPASVTNTATVSGGGETNTANDSASDPTTVTGAPDLTITKTHTGNFAQGQTGATYTITVSNAGGAATSGTVTVTDTLPAGLTATAIAGTGWTCTLASLTCTRSDTLAAAASYPAITLTVNVASNAPASVTNTATVSGGGETVTSNDTASDPTTVNGAPDLTIAKTHTGNFTQGQTGATYTITVTNVGRASTSGTSVTDTLPAGLTATAIAGTGWTCTLATLTCTRSDTLAAATSYPAITLTVNVASNAPASVTNTATVSGGGETNTSNDTASDPTTINGGPDLTITKTHTGNLAQGQTGATYTITARNAGGAATSGTVTVTDTLPAGLTATAIAGTGWTCTLATLTCTRSDTLAAAASYPAITLTVNVASNAPASVTNTATVSGGGETNTANDSASDPTTVNGTPDLTIGQTRPGNFAQGQNSSYAITVTNVGRAPTSGVVTVTDSLPAGLTATDIGGPGWTCTLATLTCTRSDTLAAGAAYQVIIVTVHVASNAPSSVTNVVTVSGGGETNTTNDSSSDLTPVNHTTSGGYWFAGSDGNVYNFGNAGALGSLRGVQLNKPIVGMASTPDGKGYWLVASDGGIFAFGTAQFHGSTGSIALNKPIVGMAAMPDGQGYWLVASDGGIFAFGTAQFHGSTGSIVLNKPIVGMAAMPDGKGYWLVASDGGIFAFGTAQFYGSTGSIALNKPIVGMAATPAGAGYWFVASDGGIFNFGDALFFGSTGSSGTTAPIVSMARD